MSLTEEVDNEIKNARMKRPKLTNFSRVGIGLSPRDIEKKIKTKKGLLKIDPSTMRISLNDLLRIANNRKKFLPTKMGDFRNVKLLSTIPNPANKSITFRGLSDGVDITKNGEVLVKNKYIVSLTFYKIKFSSKPDKVHNIKVVTASGGVYYISRVDREKSPVQTRCNCMDFSWSFSFWDHQVRALLGQVPGFVQNYVPTGTGIPRNPGHFPSFCKHLFKFAPILRQKGFIN